MKSLQIPFSLIMLFFIFSSCDELLKKDVDVPATFTLFEDVKVDTRLNPNDISYFNTGGKFDFLSHPDIAEVIGTPDKIKKIEIKKIQYEFKSFSGNVDAIIDGYFLIKVYSDPSDPNYDPDFDGLARFDINRKINVAEATISKELFTLNGNFKKVNDYLSQEVILEQGFVGTSTHNPAFFTILVTVTATVTVEASLDYKGSYN